MHWAIEPIALHRVRVPGPEVLFQRAFTETLELVIYAFLLRSPGHLCLVDTGLASDHSALNRDIRARKGDDSGFVNVAAPLPEQLRERGLVPQLVLLTSFGAYTTGSLDAFAQAGLFVSARGCTDLELPEEPALAHPLDPAVRNRLLRAQRVVREREVMPGLTLLEVGVHHPASVAVVVETADGVVGIADPVFLARNLLDGIALGAAEHAASWHGMTRVLGERCDALIPIHDPDPTPIARARWHASLHASKV
jgi:glyoxylase-like metal-dependent hydrolase (beta-lactamase superfamily II)